MNLGQVFALFLGFELLSVSAECRVRRLDSFFLLLQLILVTGELIRSVFIHTQTYQLVGVGVEITRCH